MNGFMIAYVVVSVLIIILVLAQKAKDNGFSTMTGARATDGREVGKTFEKKLQVWTTWLVVLYIILSIVFTFYQLKSSTEEENAFLDDDIYEETLNDIESETEEGTSKEEVVEATIE